MVDDYIMLRQCCHLLAIVQCSTSCKQQAMACALKGENHCHERHIFQIYEINHIYYLLCTYLSGICILCAAVPQSRILKLASCQFVARTLIQSAIDAPHSNFIKLQDIILLVMLQRDGEITVLINFTVTVTV